MKIGDVKLGEVYAYRDQNYGEPAPVRAEEVVQVEEGGSRYRPGRKVRRVRVEFVAGYATRRKSVEKGAKLTIEARALLGPWSDYAASVAEDRKANAEREAIAAYLSSMLPDSCPVSSTGYMHRYAIRIDKDHEGAQLELAKANGFYTEPEPFGEEVR